MTHRDESAASRTWLAHGKRCPHARLCTAASRRHSCSSAEAASSLRVPSPYRAPRPLLLATVLRSLPLRPHPTSSLAPLLSLSLSPPLTHLVNINSLERQFPQAFPAVDVGLAGARDARALVARAVLVVHRGAISVGVKREGGGGGGKRDAARSSREARRSGGETDARRSHALDGASRPTIAARAARREQATAAATQNDASLAPRLQDRRRPACRGAAQAHAPHGPARL